MANWTIVVWAAITNDLREPFEADLKEVALALATRESAAGPGSGSIQLHVAQTLPTAKRLKLPPPINSLGTVADGKALRTKLLARGNGWAGTKTDPHRKRLLVLWGHGARGLPDEKDQRLIVPAADEVITAFTASSGTAPPAPDIVGYDACRMASAATVMTLARELKSVFIGSMIPEPVSGWPYTELLRMLSDNSDPKAASAAIVQAYAASVDVPDWCLAAFDLDKIGPLAAALTTLNRVALPGETDFFAAASGADTLDDTDLVDLGALMRRLTDQPVTMKGANALIAAADGVRQAIREATVMRRASGNLAGRDGLSVLVKVPGQQPEPPPVRTSPTRGGPPSAVPPWGKYLEDEIFA
jgi:hypothetical protein